MRLATFFSLLLCVAASGPLAAQPCDPAQVGKGETCPDTTYWQRYSPLEAGNIWQYRYEGYDFPDFGYQVIAEEMIDGVQHYLIRGCEAAEPGAGPSCDEAARVRYDGERQAVMRRGEEGGDVSYYPWFSGIYCPLGVSFGEASLGCGDYGVSGFVSGAYGVGHDFGNGVAGDTRKQFTTEVFGSAATYVAGLGYVGSVDMKTQRGVALVYARIGGEQYGTPTFASCDPADLESDEVCPDTTDWHRYFPLDVGNQWQHHVDRFIEPPYDHGTEIIGETEIDGESYFLARRCEQGAFEEEPTCSDSFPVRYDEDDRVVVRRVVDGEGNVSFRPYHTSDFGGPQPLDAVFCIGGDEMCTSRYVSVTGAYDVGFEELGDTEKSFDDGLQGTVTLVAGVGVVASESGENDFFEGLSYARVGGESAGSPLFDFPVDDEFEATPATGSGFTAAFPNPVQETVTARYALASAQTVTLEVVDLLGRCVRTLEIGWQTVGAHEVSVETAGLPAGLYLLRLRGGDGVMAVRRVAVIR